MRGRALIVNGSTGIAAATARLAAAAGARILIASGESDSAWELAAETGAECWIGDLARPEAAESAVTMAVQKFGRIDAVFNASGLSGRRFGDGPVHEASDSGWELTLAHNLTVVFHMCRAAVSQMLGQEQGEVCAALFSTSGACWRSRPSRASSPCTLTRQPKAQSPLSADRWHRIMRRIVFA